MSTTLSDQLATTPLYGSNAAYVEGLYDQYLRDPASVGAAWREYFARLGPTRQGEQSHTGVVAAIAQRARLPRLAGAPAPAAMSTNLANAKQGAVARLVQIWANRGPLVAQLDPLGLLERPMPRVLELDYFGLTEADLDTEFFTGSRSGSIAQRLPLREIIKQLRLIYGGPIGAEFAHVSDTEQRLWLQDEFQAGRLLGTFSADEKKNFLWQLTTAEGLER